MEEYVLYVHRKLWSWCVLRVLVQASRQCKHTVTCKYVYKLSSTTLAKKIETGTQAKHRHMHARQITHLPATCDGCLNFFGQGT